MPQQVTPLANETASDIAARLFGDSSLFREVLAANPGLGAFSEINAETIAAPLSSELLSFADPALTSVRTGVESALLTGSNALDKVKSYASVLDSVGLGELSAEVNGAFGQVENVLTKGQDAARKYTDGTRLVDWLLG